MVKKVYLILHDIRSVENVGSIFRTADGAGVTKIFLTGYTPTPLDRFGRKRKDIAKVALGAEESMEWEEKKDPISLIKELRRTLSEIKIIGLEQHKKSIDYRKFKVPRMPFGIIVGNEVGGIPEKILKMCDQIVEIPMKGKKESLNVSVATGIALFQLI